MALPDQTHPRILGGSEGNTGSTGRAMKRETLHHTMTRNEWLIDKYQMNLDSSHPWATGECRHGYGFNMPKTDGASDPYTLACAVVTFCRGKHLASLICYDD